MILADHARLLLFILSVAIVQALTILFCAERAPTIFWVCDLLTSSRTEPESSIECNGNRFH
jgi:hypothetical protein